jgi:ParB family chromosome partitioning protein
VANKRKTGLGRGFESLIPSDIGPDGLDDNDLTRVKDILITDVVVSASQPRKLFDGDAHRELVTSIKTHGVLQPIVVEPHGVKFRLVAGERRWRAARAAGLERIPAVLRSLDDRARLEVALIENIQRRKLNPLELAEAFVRLNKQFSMAFEEIAERVGKAHATVANTARLVNLPAEARDALLAKKISEGHARSILALQADPKKQRELLEYIIKFNWPVRKAEQYVRAYKDGASGRREAVKRVAATSDETKAISRALKTPVRLRRSAKGGELLIRFKDDKDLKRLAKKLSSA